MIVQENVTLYPSYKWKNWLEIPRWEPTFSYKHQYDVCVFLENAILIKTYRIFWEKIKDFSRTKILYSRPFFPEKHEVKINL